jgi:serine/threonine protein kinase/tetratricopeptide (TPR) repeat protein
MSESGIFKAAVKLPPDARAAYLDQACGSDAALRGEVESLLHAHDTSAGFLEHGAAGADATFDYQQSAERPRTVIGPYKLIEQIGEGGMGSVWMAQQIEPVKRLVAVKLVKAGMDSQEVIARFEAERQALALMDHPNIARVLDAGTSSAGRPYFVMDLVKGEPITRYCDEHHLTLRQRLELFVTVCQAIQHAHQKGIIHRDLKPSNVLVAPYDGRPVVKVIDFGVAKAAGQQLTERTLVTGFGAIVGTLEYMSPEQAELNNQDIDTRSDIYALGVLLYELMAGTPPFSRKELEDAGMLEMLRVIREQEPSKPSTKLSTADGLPTLAANRGTEPAKLAKLVRGELDWIVMKALEKDRTRRYETANDFARDIQRYLADEPVEACPPSTGYKLRKFARKNRKGLVTTGCFLVLLVAAAVVSTLLAIRAMRAEVAANANAEKARRSADEAKRNAQQARDEANAKAVALEAEQQARADETKARQQAFAALRSMTAEVVERKFAQGTTLTEDDRAFLRGVIAQFDAFAAIKGDDADSRAVRAEGRWRVGAIRWKLGELKEAEQDYDQALSIYEQLAADVTARPEFRQQRARSHNARGNLLRQKGRLEEAEKDYDQALSIQKQLTADFPDRPEFRQQLASSHNNRSLLLMETGRLKEAEQDLDQSVGIQKRLAAEFPSRTKFRHELATSHCNRGALLAGTGRLEEAEQDYDRALNILKQLVVDFPARPDFRQELARSHDFLGQLLKNSGRIQEVEQHYNQTLSIRKQLAADFPSRPEFRRELAWSHANLGNLLVTTGRRREAEQDFDQSFAVLKQLTAEFPNRREFRHELATSHCNRGALLADTGRLHEAERDYNEARSILKQLAADFPNRLPNIQNSLASVCTNLALLHLKQGNPAAAKQQLLEGRPHNLAALKTNPRQPTYRHHYRNHLGALTMVHAELLEQKDALRTAEICRDLSWNAPEDAYNAACFLSLCIPIAAKHKKLDDEQRKETVQFYGDAAMKLLREAVTKGFKDLAHIKKDADLDPLRQRGDFQKLVAELERKGK